MREEVKLETQPQAPASSLNISKNMDTTVTTQASVRFSDVHSCCIVVLEYRY